MSDKDRIDDFASLFLPDILNPLGGMDGAVKLEDDPAAFSRNNTSNLSTPSSTGLSAFRFLSGEPPNPRVASEPMDWQFSPAGAAAGPAQGYYAHPAVPDYTQLRHSPFPGSDMGHMSHYADLFPAEAAVPAAVRPQVPMRQYAMQMAPKMGEYRAAVPAGAFAGVGGAPAESPAARREPKRAQETPPKAQSHMRAPEEFKVEYAAGALLRLLDLKSDMAERPRVLDHAGRPVGIRVVGFLRGKFLTSDYDNYNYLMGARGAVDLAQTHQPQVIAYFRRNFINIYLKLCFHSPGSGFAVNGEPVLRFRVVVRAFTDGPDRKKVSVTTKHQEADPKDFQKMGDKLPIDTIHTNHVIPLAACRAESYFNVKKLQFKTATANSTNFGVQTYNKLFVMLVADLPSGECVVDRLTTPPIIVRGRNPSFYYSRHDTLIETRLPQYSSSYDASAFEDAPRTDAAPAHAAPAAAPAPAKNDDDDDADTDDSSGPDPKEKPDSTVPSGTNLGKYLTSMKTERSDNYHYFPISNVYYLPPINVVYFPHGAHHEESRDAQAADPAAPLQSPQAGGDRKGERSRVYFKS